MAVTESVGYASCVSGHRLLVNGLSGKKPDEHNTQRDQYQS